MFTHVVMNSCLVTSSSAERGNNCATFTAGSETASLVQSGTETVWPVLFSPLKNHLGLRDEEDTLMILASYGEEKTQNCMFVFGVYT